MLRNVLMKLVLHLDFSFILYTRLMNSFFETGFIMLESFFCEIQAIGFVCLFVCFLYTEEKESPFPNTVRPHGIQLPLWDGCKLTVW